MTRCALLLLAMFAAATAYKLNIVHVMVDDAGWDDFELHDPIMRTSNISKIGQEGLFLNQSYVNPSCSPSRAAFLTGRYPHTFGAQTGISLRGYNLFWVNETYSMISNEMKKLGYKTHALGKWHLGLCHPSLTPLGRGFDTFYGFLLGAHYSYWDHSDSSLERSYDWWDNDKIDFTANGTYSTELLTDRMVKIIEESNKKEPFFAYLAYQAPHGPFQVPQYYIDEYCPHVNNTKRQIQCGMMAAIDAGIGKIVKALKDKNIYNDTAIIIMSDNGGPTGNYSSNYPLRGTKKTVYEGGTRSYTVLKAPGLNKTNETWSGLINMVDWMPTLLRMAGGKKMGWMHGKDLWYKIKNFRPRGKNSFLYSYDDYYKLNHWAFRLGNWKLIKGFPGFHLGWYPPYNLIESGIAKYEEVKKQKNYTDYYELYNIKKDPEERNNLRYIKQSKFERIKEKMEAFLDKFPLQPFQEPVPNEEWLDETKGIINTCSCQPEGKPDC